MNKRDLPPSAVVLDLVLQYTPTLTGKAGTAAIPSLAGETAVILFARNHRNQFVQLQVPVAFDGETRDGSDGRSPRWVLNRIAPTVWKISQSVLSPELHAYVTIVGVPEPAPWT